jgi:hypothetical protein
MQVFARKASLEKARNALGKGEWSAGTGLIIEAQIPSR